MDNAKHAGAGRREEIVRLRHNVYIGKEELSDVGAAERHVFDVGTDLLALGAAWHAARRSAAVVHGIPLIGKNPTVPQLVADPGSADSSGRDRHRRFARLDDAERDVVGGLRVESLARMVADIARAESLRNAVVVADAVLGRGIDEAELESCLAGMRRWPGVVRARRAVAFADGLAETPLESISRVAIHQLGLPPPELQVEVWLGRTFLGRVDKLWREFNTVGEADGFVKYELSDELTRRQLFRAEKVRQEGMEDVGLEVARWTWDDAWHPKGVLDDRLERAFARGARQTLDPRVRFVPTTVADRLRKAS